MATLSAEPILKAGREFGNEILKLGQQTTVNNINAMKKTVELARTQGLSAAVKNTDGTYNYGNMARLGAAGWIGGSVGYRALSGGGLYRDADGNTDIIGIPFI